MKKYGSMSITTKLPSSENYDSRTYKTVEIGDQTWMAEDVKNFAIPKYDYNNNNGVLYTFDAANSTMSPLCYQDWRLPSSDDLQKLKNFVKGDINKLKATNGWNDGKNGTDDYGFAAKPAGSSCNGATREYVGTQGHWWAGDGQKFSIYDDRLDLNGENKSCYLSVRCIKR